MILKISNFKNIHIWIIFLCYFPLIRLAAVNQGANQNTLFPKNGPNSLDVNELSLFIFSLCFSHRGDHGWLVDSFLPQIYHRKFCLIVWDDQGPGWTSFSASTFGRIP
jgi:hypothetical protein